MLADSFKRNVVVTGVVFSEDGTSELPEPKAGSGFSGSLPPDYMIKGIRATRNIPVLDAASSGYRGDQFPVDR